MNKLETIEHILKTCAYFRVEKDCEECPLISLQYEVCFRRLNIASEPSIYLSILRTMPYFKEVH